MKNVISGSVTETTFNPADKFPPAYVERKDLEYLYNDGDLFYFMDLETYEQIPLNKDVLGDSFQFVKENTSVKVLSFKGSVFGVEPPNFVELEVTETDPGFKGDTATNVTKTGRSGDRRNGQSTTLHRYRRQSQSGYPFRRIS